MAPEELLSALLDLAAEVGLEVRNLIPSASDAPPTSAVCRVRDAVWVVLVSGDPIERRTEVLVTALREHAGPELESRFLPPALRERLGS